jgi:hypothetical protein
MAEWLSHCALLDIIQQRVDYKENVKEALSDEVESDTNSFGRRLGLKFKTVSLGIELANLGKLLNLDVRTLHKNFQLFLYLQLNPTVCLTTRSRIAPKDLPSLEDNLVGYFLF